MKKNIILGDNEEAKGHFEDAGGHWEEVSISRLSLRLSYLSAGLKTSKLLLIIT